MYRKSLILLACSMLLYSIGMAQFVSFDWAKPFTISGPGGSGQVETDPSGDVYVSGIFEGTIDLDPGPATMLRTSAGRSDLYIAKMSPAGSLLWAITIGGSETELGAALKFDAAGNLYVSGTFSGTLDFDPGPGVVQLTATSSSCSFLLKLNPNGDLIWARLVNESVGSGFVYGCNMEVTPAGAVYLYGFFGSSVDFDPGVGVNLLNTSSVNDRDIYISKFDANGAYQWARAFTGAPLSPTAVSLATDGAENVFVTGSFAGNCDFDPGPGVYNLVSTGDLDVFICKLDANGNFGWANRLGSPAVSDIGYAIASDPSGNIVITGTYFGNCDFDPGPGTFIMSANYGPNGFILKLTTNGNFIWSRQLRLAGPGVCYSSGLYIDISGEIFTFGEFAGTVDFDPSPAQVIESNWSSASFIARFTEDGFLIDAKKIGSTGSALVANDLCLDALKNYYLTGYFIESPDFDPTGNTFFMNPSAPAPYSDGFVMKLHYCRNITYDTISAVTCEPAFTLNNHVYDTSGTYLQVLVNRQGCDSLLRLYLTMNPKQFTAIDTTICEGQSVYAGGNNQTAEGVYTDVLQTYLGCDSTITTTLHVNKKPKPDLGPDRGICTGSNEILTPGSFTTYQWQDGSTTNSYPVNTTGLYWVTVTDANDCIATDSLSVNAILPLPANFLPSTDTICQYDDLLLKPAGNFTTYAWSTGATSASILVNDPGQYILIATDRNGCTGADTTLLARKTCPIAMLIPSGFTPNGDMRNDVFKATVYGRVVSFKLEVFNRNGELIFRTIDPNQGWNGNHKGKQVDPGVFVWQCSYQLTGEQPVYRKGIVTLIR